MELLERSPHLDRLDELLNDAARRSGHLLFLEGEAGIGKTALMGSFAERARGRARVLVGACDSLATPRPLGPLLDMRPDLATRSGTGIGLFSVFLEELVASRQPVVAIFEDVHWADQATLDLLRYLARRVIGTRALLVATFRGEEVGRLHPLRILLGDIATHGGVRRMSLEPLSREAVALLAQGSALDPAHLYRKTGGNPFFVTEVLRSGLDGVPATVRDAILARAARLSPEARDVLDAAALTGLTVEPWLIGRVVEAAEGGLRECVESGLLRRTGATLAFRHELARAAVEASIDVARSFALHRAVLAILAAGPTRDADPARLAHHAEAAGDRQAVLAYAPEAARRAAALGAHREAALEYGRALQFANDLDVHDRATLLEARAFECLVSNQLEESLDARRAALALRRELGDRFAEGDNLRWIARAEWMVGRMKAADEAASEAVAVLESVPPSAQLAIAYTHRGHLAMLRFRNREAVRWCRKALRLLDRFGDDEAKVHALINMAVARLQQGDDGGFPAMEEAIREGLRANLVDHVARAYFHCVQVTTVQRRHALSESWFERAHAYCVEQEHETLRRFLLAHRARSMLNQGRWSEAESMARDVLARTPSPDVGGLHALTVLSLLQARQGDPQAASYLNGSRDEAMLLGTDGSWSIGLWAARGEVAWQTGARTHARVELESVIDAVAWVGEPWETGEVAYWLWRSGGRAIAPGSAAEPWARQITGMPEEAAALWDSLGCPYEAAQALAESDAEAALRRALDILEALGAKPAAAQVRSRLRRLGARGVKLGPRASTLANPAHLTGRELEVLKLLAQGMPNADIADRLFVSTRTVDHHVGAILGKLGVSTRTAAAQEASRLGLVEG